MTVINMRREKLQGIDHCEHAGLLIDRGFKADRGEKLHNDDKMELFAQAKKIPCPNIYKQAYKNWRQSQIENLENSRIWFGKLENRMYLGMGVASPLEAGITLHHTYGVPFIPGSAIKGVLRHYVDDLDLDKDKKDMIKKIIFGEDASSNNKQDSGAAGYLIFNDAWWVPEGKALAPEVITVHAPKYYADKGKKFLHPDFESPNPNPQIAIQGSFLFSIEGDTKWVEYAIKLLAQCMESKGIGGKAASGYGYFNKSHELCDKLIKQRESYKDQKIADDLDDAYKNLPEHEKIVVDFYGVIDGAPESSAIPKNNYGEWVGKATQFIKACEAYKSEYSEESRKEIKELLTNYYDKIGWYSSGLKKPKRKKQKSKKEKSITSLFSQE